MPETAPMSTTEHLVAPEHLGLQSRTDFRQQAVTLETAQKGRADFKLSVGQLQTTINVDSAAPQLAPQDSSVGSVVDNTYVSNFPLLLRSWDDLLNLAAGVQLGTGARSRNECTAARPPGGGSPHARWRCALGWPPPGRC